MPYTMQASKGLNYTLSKSKTYYSVSGIGTCTDTRIVIPPVYQGKPVENIGYSAFFGCSHLRIIIIPNSVTSISNSAFKGCTALKNITIPASVTSLGSGAFAGCSSLMNVEILGNISEIKETTFYNCTRLTRVLIPATVKIIDNLAFKKCKMLTVVYYKGTKAQWSKISIGKDNGRITHNKLTRATINFVGDEYKDCAQDFNHTPFNNQTSSIDVNTKVSQTLYIYKGNIICHRNRHNIISATATLHNISDRDIVINVEYCQDCHKYLLSYDLFMRYRERYGVLIGDLKIVTNDYFEGETDLAEESPLHLSGYNVGQKDDYSSNQRHYILARIIHDGIMTKQAVLNYLSYFVRMNGARWGMELAVSKWKEDISFVQDYNMSTQPKTIISRITKY